MTNNLFNAYDILGILPHATTIEIKRAYKEKAKLYHPDKEGNAKSANELFKLITQAKDILIDPKSRLEHDYAIGLKKRPQPIPEKEYIPVPEDDSIDIKTVLGVGLAGLAIGGALAYYSTKKRRKKR